MQWIKSERMKQTLVEARVKPKARPRLEQLIDFPALPVNREAIVKILRVSTAMDGLLLYYCQMEGKEELYPAHYHELPEHVLEEYRRINPYVDIEETKQNELVDAGAFDPEGGSEQSSDETIGADDDWRAPVAKGRTRRPTKSNTINTVFGYSQLSMVFL
jgi:hypothetical protein